MSVRKTVTVKKGQVVNYTITQSGVVVASGSKTIDNWESVIINEEKYTFTLNVEPADASYTIVSDDGSVAEDNTIKAKVGSTIGYTVSKPGYTTVSDIYVLDESDYTKNVKLDVTEDEFDFLYRIYGTSCKLPFIVGETTGDYDLDIHWGDGTSTLIPSGTVLTSVLLTHAYSEEDYYSVEIRSTADKMPTVSFYNDTKVVSIETPLMETTSTSTTINNQGMFMNCSNLSAVSADLFKYNPQIVDFNDCFRGCSSLTAVSGNLFKYNTNALSFMRAFEGSGLTSIPTDLFKYNTKACKFAYCFQNCSNLATMPSDLFAYCTEVGTSPFDMTDCFNGCSKLTLSSDIFGTNKTTRFASYPSVIFNGCFNATSFTGTSRGTAPDLWSWTYANVSKTNCFGGVGNAGLTNYANIPMAWGGSGVTLTINPTPSNANVVLTATGYIQVNNSITVDVGTNVSYTVSKDGYESDSGIITVYTTRTENINLTQLFTYTISPSPADATVVLTAPGCTQSGNSIVVPYGTEVSWSVSKTGYVSQSGVQTVTENKTDTVILVLSLVRYTINPTPADATVVLTATGYTQTNNYIDVAPGTEVVWEVSKTGYETRNGSSIINTATTVSIELTELVTLTINPTPSDANVVLEVVS